MDHLQASRVFVVDDEQVIATTLAAILNLNGFSARAFSSPLEALAAARADMPDLLISDVVMPDLSGIDLAILLRALCPTCKILLCSGQARTADVLKDARRRGHYFRLLDKPVFPARMLSEIDKLQDEPISPPQGESEPGLHLMK